MYNYQPETLCVFEGFTSQFKDEQYALRAHRVGYAHEEPLYVLADQLIRYAKMYNVRFTDHKIGQDSFASLPFSHLCHAVLQLSAMDGGCAMGQNRTNDSKDNSVVNALIEKACEIAGINYDELSF